MARARKRFAGSTFSNLPGSPSSSPRFPRPPHDRFIEIGPGRGAITEPLAARADRLVAVEIDRDLAAALTARGLPNVTVINDDVLQLDVAKIADADER